MTAAALRRRLEAMEKQQADQDDEILERIAQRLKEAGQLPDDSDDDGYQPPAGWERMTIGELTLDRLRWKHRDQ